MILNDVQIKELCNPTEYPGAPMIHPFLPVQEGKPSYGLGSFGYDIRLGHNFLIPIPMEGRLVDPLKNTAGYYNHIKACDFFDMPPHSMVLAESLEIFQVPDDVMGVCWGKSTYARCGVLVNVTPLEPCFSDDTEILTKDNGWVLIKDVKLGQLVLTREPDGTAVWGPVIDKQKNYYRGDLMHFNGRSIDLMVTPDHDLFVRRRITEQGPWSRVKADKVFGHYNYSMSRKVNWRGKDIPDTIVLSRDQGQQILSYSDVEEIRALYKTGEFTQNDLADKFGCSRTNISLIVNNKTRNSGVDDIVEIDTNIFLEFFGAYLGDGSSFIDSKRDYIIKLAGLKERKKQLYSNMIDKMGFKHHYDGKSTVFISKAVFNVVHSLGHAGDKYIPSWIKELPPHRLQHLWLGLLASDGNQETESYSTTSKRLANDVQEILFKMGSAAIVRHVSNDLVKSAYIIRKSNSTLNPRIRPETHLLESYIGDVYDVTVPNHVVFVRRNGKPVWSGNCWSGVLTIEISNLSSLPVRLHVEKGIAQLVFFRGCRPERTYVEKESGGIYQNQTGVTPAR